MSIPASTDRIERFFHHLSMLKSYARRTLVSGDPLNDAEESERRRLMAEFLEIGASFDLSEKEMVMILFRELPHAH